MAADKATLKASIKSAMNAALAVTDPANRASAVDTQAGAIADAVDTYVKSITITIAPGAIVTVGSATTQACTAGVIVTGGVS